MTETKLHSFETGDNPEAVTYLETMEVKEGVVCDIYSFKDADSRDLAIVTVEKGFKTPLQRVIKGDFTAEGFMSGKGELSVTNKDGEMKTYQFNDDNTGQPVLVSIGEQMQWHANGDTNLVFYEVCSPPYEDGRFENLPEPSSSPLQ